MAKATSQSKKPATKKSPPKKKSTIKMDKDAGSIVGAAAKRKYLSGL